MTIYTQDDKPIRDGSNEFSVDVYIYDGYHSGVGYYNYQHEIWNWSRFMVGIEELTGPFQWMYNPFINDKQS